VFESRGTAAEVPKYLRYAGTTIRNRKLSKRETELLIKDILAEKLKYDRLHSRDTVRALQNLVSLTHCRWKVSSRFISSKSLVFPL